MKDKKAAEPAGMNDAALVERAKNGDQAAYTALYESTAQETFRSIRSMVRTEEQALDIQQDAYVYAFTHLDTLGEPKKFRAWLRAIAVNRTRSVLRKQTPVLFSELESQEGEGLPELADTDPAASPELALERKETAAYLREILGELTVGQRMLVGLYYYEQQSVGQIAEALEVTPGTVKTQLFRARKRIESAVKALEQRGVKLWGLSPLPFMLSLMKRSEPAAEASRTVLQGALSQTGLGAETVAVHVGRGFFQTVLGRAVLGVAAAAALGGGVLAYGWVREHYVLGDVQPPTETVLLLQTTEETRDADKDLTPIPTQIQDTEAPDTPEDLTEPDTTEPTTEPELTEPTTEPTPSDPPAPSPGGQSPEPSDDFDSPPATEPSASTTNTILLGWSDNSSSSPKKNEIQYYDCPPTTYAFLIVYVQGEAVPSLYSDNETVSAVSRYQGKEDLGNGKWAHHWEIYHNGSGTANIYCSVGGVSTKVARTDNPEHRTALGYTAWSGWGETDVINDAKVGSGMTLFSRAVGSEALELVTDAPSLFSISKRGADQNGPWYETSYAWNVVPNAAGTGHLFLKLGGNTVKTFTVTVLDAPPETSVDSAEDLSEQP